MVCNNRAISIAWKDISQRDTRNISKRLVHLLERSFWKSFLTNSLSVSRMSLL